MALVTLKVVQSNSLGVPQLANSAGAETLITLAEDQIDFTTLRTKAIGTFSNASVFATRNLAGKNGGTTYVNNTVANIRTAFGVSAAS